MASNTDFTESDLENSILSNLQKFLMELGKGYAFVARQQHIHTEKQDYYINLVFYNYILKCFVLIDLKTQKITHQDVGQMDMYIRMYDELKRSEGDNPTIGIVLCSDTDEDIAKYSILHGNEQLFASKYKLYLPTEEELRAEIENQKTMFYLQQQENNETKKIHMLTAAALLEIYFNQPCMDYNDLMKLTKILTNNNWDDIDNMYRRMRRLICFDMDSTLIETEVIDELAIRAGVGDEVKAITESAMRGEIDFTESFTRRVALLKGLDESVMQEIAESLPITEGVERLMYVLKKYGYKIAILSGGFTYFGQYLQKKYGIDYVYANELEIIDGKLTGRYLGDVVDGKRKAELLRLIAQVEKVDIAQTIAVGDGANDLPMLGVAGLGIAFHAKPKVVANAKQSINTIGLDGVLYFLGFKDSYLNM